VSTRPRRCSRIGISLGGLSPRHAERIWGSGWSNQVPIPPQRLVSQDRGEQGRGSAPSSLQGGQVLPSSVFRRKRGRVLELWLDRKSPASIVQRNEGQPDPLLLHALATARRTQRSREAVLTEGLGRGSRNGSRKRISAHRLRIWSSGRPIIYFQEPIFSSVAINKDTTCRSHVDAKNASGLGCMTVFGKFNEARSVCRACDWSLTFSRAMF